MGDTHATYRSPEQEPTGSCVSRYKIAFLIFSAIAAFYLIAEHGAHVFGVLPWLLLLACGLLHLWMHSGHGGHGPQPGSDTSRRGAHQH